MFWYLGKYIDETQFEHVFAAQLVLNTHLNILAKVSLFHSAHIITFYLDGKPFGSEILATHWPQSLTLSQPINFKIQSDLYLQEKGWEISTTQYNMQEIGGLLRQKNSLQHQIDKENWSAVAWKVTQDRISFTGLHTVFRNNLSLWTKTSYQILQEEKNLESRQNRQANF